MPGFFAHPRGLYVCFTTELWERFSYYGMRALLIYYLTQHWLYSDAQSYGIYGAYTTLIWGLPVVGGILADRYLGQRRAVIIGALLLSSGHVLMAVEGPAAIETVRAGAVQVQREPLYLNLFFLSLALIACGVGFLKSNITTLVGALYSQNDPRRDSAFTLFYLGINVGSAAAPLICGWLGQSYGWQYGFGLAGLGMLLGLLVFLRGQKHLAGFGDPPRPQLLRREVIPGFTGNTITLLGAAALVLVVWQLLIHHDHLGAILGGFGMLLGVKILHFSFARCAPIERDRMLAVLALICFAILFWSFHQQIGSSLNLFSDRVVQRQAGGFEIKASQLQSVPALFVILLAPIFSFTWTLLGARSREPSTPVKFSLGLAFVGLAFLMPVAGATFADAGAKIGLVWLALTFCFMVCGELCIAPVAMNLVTRLCPRRVVGMMMGAYFLSLSVGSFVAGQLAKLTQIQTHAGDVTDIGAAVKIYVSTYSAFGWTALGAAVVLYLLTPLLYRRMHEGVELDEAGTSRT